MVSDHFPAQRIREFFSEIREMFQQDQASAPFRSGENGCGIIPKRTIKARVEHLERAGELPAI
jgi:hypothetical protein